MSETLFAIIPVRRRRWFKRPLAVAVAVAVAVSGCVLKRDEYAVPDVPLTDQYLQMIAGAPGAASPPGGYDGPTTSLEEIPPHWWRLFNDETLNRLMDSALSRNHDLRIANLRVAQEKARLGQTKADEYPVLSAPVSAEVDAPPDGAGSVRSDEDVVSQRAFTASLRAQWRVDLWGERRAASQSAEYRLWAAILARDEQRRVLASDVVSAYAAYLELNDRHTVAVENERALTRQLAIMGQRRESGGATTIEVEQQRAEVYAAQALQSTLMVEREQARHRLAVLAGVTPAELDLPEDAGLDRLTLTWLRPGAPSALILRRPDVRAAEAELLAADADIDVARARVLPPLDLSARAGYGSAYVSQLFQPHTLVWDGLATLTTAIFDYGRRESAVEEARSRHEELVERYVLAIYRAVREVEDALAAVRLNEARMTALSKALEASRKALRLSCDSYRSGVVNYETLLDTERTFNANADEMSQARRARATALADLFTALGGGLSAIQPVSGGAARRGRGGKDGVVLTAAPPGPPSSQVILWDQSQWAKRGWSVVLPAVYSVEGVRALWRSLSHDLPQLVESLQLWPERLGRVETAPDGETRPVEWFRVRLGGGLSARKDAQSVCDTLIAAGRRCSIKAL